LNDTLEIFQKSGGRTYLPSFVRRIWRFVFWFNRRSNIFQFTSLRDVVLVSFVLLRRNHMDNGQSCKKGGEGKEK